MARESKTLFSASPLENRKIILGGYRFQMDFGKKVCTLISDPKTRFPFENFIAFNQAYYGTFYQPDRRILGPKEVIEPGNSNFMPLILPKDLFSPRFQPDENYALAHNAASYRETRNCLLPTGAMEDRERGTLLPLLFGSVSYLLKGDALQLISKTNPPFSLDLKDVLPTGKRNSYEIWVDEKAQKMLAPDLKNLVNPDHTALYKFDNFLVTDPIGMAINQQKEPTLFLAGNPFRETYAGQRLLLGQVSEEEKSRIARQEYDRTPVQKNEQVPKKGFRL